MRTRQADLNALGAFAGHMRRKLNANAGKTACYGSPDRRRTGWSHMSHEWLLGRLKAEVVELERALAIGPNVNRKAIVNEAADVANFAMMIAEG